ncbi:hypothetical protein [Paucibacter sp. KCTC 42545]|uniref:hypothetical protein n=1 Tax=Paucibacter sp. KCTC 42545 TaxID=1768242 RepID=UPI000733ABD4|nr:hypothetical protein [Paucibacter sp. KCTC 42545]ALT75962.1 hypothetical protein AT984_00755 [Paucibacter sp. KCTC 42545]
MNTFIRIALAWLLALAIPVQGIAATAMLMCAPSHAGAGVMAEPLSEASPSAQHAAMLADCLDEQEAEMAAAAAALFDHCGQADQAEQADHHAPGQDGHQKAQGHCSACAACCGVAVIGQALLSLPVLQTTGMAQISPLPQSHDRELCGGIERPPRPARA